MSTALPATRLSFVGVEPEAITRIKAAPTPAALGALRIGIICNPRAHRNHGAGYAAGVPGADSVLIAAPRTTEALVETLAGFAERRIDLLVIDGGDGTVRDVLTAAGQLWQRDWPAIAVIPSGKTNALAIDLGVPAGWTLGDALSAMAQGRTVIRRPVEIARDDDSLPLRGFLFGTGAFVKATELAQHTHRAGAFNGVAVGLALGWALMLTAFGARDNAWRAGDRMDVRLPGGPVERDPLYLLLASTLERLPVGLRPFGRPRQGLKLLTVDAPPRWLPVTVPALLGGSEAAWLKRAGFHNRDAAAFDVTPDDGFILDGELFAGGQLSVHQGPVLSFVVP
ncbi:diacylglycerol kinase family protein [Sphingomonas sp. KR1UV-12]|uniref:Diacylglycerol kinase family protein n=1 Tax=Sphingomonas aurea TaxID=3063994 RepID=A0ABT9EKP0_9SPHN|nr:diacylglycerol kinase family protein [Sphingomonas sp. KR1UV-12]MDP1027543.1 diacylglycerol kinase family protein [Sphingomonas sp. KR1UV-12]